MTAVILLHPAARRGQPDARPRQRGYTVSGATPQQRNLDRLRIEWETSVAAARQLRHDPALAEIRGLVMAALRRAAAARRAMQAGGWDVPFERSEESTRALVRSWEER